MSLKNSHPPSIAFIRRFFEEVNKDDLSHYDDFFSPDVIIHGPASQQKIEGLQAVKKIDASYIDAYPNKQFTLEEITASDDRVFVHWTCLGKHKGPYKSLQPKNPLFEIKGFSIYRLANGKIVEVWQFWDRLGLLEQIGEITFQTDPVEPGYYLKILQNFGLEKYVKQAPSLSPRERECLRSLLAGEIAKETAATYDLSPRTVESYFENIKKKLNCHSKRDLFTIAQALDKLELL